MRLTCSDLCGKDGHNANVGGLVQHDGNETISFGVPIGGGRTLNARAVILLDDASHDVLEVLAQLCKFLNDLLNDLLGPLVDFVALVDELGATNDSLDGVLCNALHLLGVEVLIVLEISHSSLARLKF